MQPSRNVRWAYGVRFSTLPLFHLSYDKNGNWFAVLTAKQRIYFVVFADSEKRIYKYANKLNTKGAYLWKKQLQYLQLKKQENY